MSIITFRELNSKREPTGPTFYLRFDALTSEEISRRAEITTYPIETGAVLSDHYQPQPREITMRGVVSDTMSGPWNNIEENMTEVASHPQATFQPVAVDVRASQEKIRQATGLDISTRGRAGVMRPVNTGILPSRRIIRANAERAGRLLPEPASVLQVVAGQSVERIAEFVNILDWLMTERVPVTAILMTGFEYTNLMLSDLTVPRLAGSGGSVDMTLHFKEVVLADAAVISQAPVRSNARAPKKAKGNRGKKRPSGLSAKQAAKIQEFSRSLTEGKTLPVTVQ